VWLLKCFYNHYLIARPCGRERGKEGEKKEDKFLLFKSPSPWYSVIRALADKQKIHDFSFHLSFFYPVYVADHFICLPYKAVKTVMVLNT
jgi:hypothetical protein